MRNSRATGRDMIISLAVLLVPCLLIYWWFSRVPDQPQVPVADWKPVVAQAHQQATYQVLSPAGLPESWKPVRAIWSDQELQLGYQGPNEVYYELKEQAGANNPGLVKDATGGAHEDGTSKVSGRTWTRMVSNDDRTRCLVNVDKGSKPVTRMACANTDYEGVEAFVSTLA